MRTTTWFALTLSLACSTGCSFFEPRWHSGDGTPLQHIPAQAFVHRGSLSISGELDRVCAFTDYGVKVYSVTDDRGTQLAFRSAQIRWAKAMCFEIEVAEPAPDAKSVDYDIAFTSRSGVSRLKGTLPIQRLGPINYPVALDRWNHTDIPSSNRGKSK